MGIGAMAESAYDRYKREKTEQAEALRAKQDAAPRPPAVSHLCLNHTLYAPIQLNPDRDEDYVQSLKFNPQQFDAFCIYCGREATFRTLSSRQPEEIASFIKSARFNNPAKDRLKRLVFEEGQFGLHLVCTRNLNHLYSYFFEYDQTQGVLTKIGQKPSLEDVAGADIERYRKILGNDFAELRKATGLFAHGIGIGSFVYLRRIFENLVETARVAADPAGERGEEFNQMRISDRVKELKEHLPPAVVKYKEAYGILSKGLHELTEAECKLYFPVVRAAIIMMLEQRYEATERAKAAAELDRAMSAIATEIKG